MLVNVTIPVYNEQQALPVSIAKLHTFLSNHFPYNWEIVIVDNGSTDSTWSVARRESKRFPNIRAEHLELKGRGRALKAAWQATHADILSYMDVDLSTDLAALPALTDALASGSFDLATGSRLQKESQVVRGLKREIIS